MYIALNWLCQIAVAAYCCCIVCNYLFIFRLKFEEFLSLVTEKESRRRKGRRRNGRRERRGRRNGN